MTLQLISKARLAQHREKWGYKPDIDFRRLFRESLDAQKQRVYEFIGTGSFNKEFIERQRYEVDAGREQEPLLFEPLYSVTEDATLPKNVSINVLGPSGVVFERREEGGEVKFATVGQSTKSVEIVQYATGLRYTEDIFIYNELWRLANLERQFGIAYNALLNHIHLYPILAYSYGSGNQTDGTALTTFKADASMPEKYLRALEAAIVTAKTDTDNPRYGPYWILCSSADMFTFERALGRVPQQGFDLQSSVLGMIRGIIAYDGWTGTRGEKTTTYTGVSSGTAYLVDVSQRDMDFQSYFKHGLRQLMGQGEPTRYVMQETLWDVRLGVYASPVRAVEAITLPTAASGAA